jgi:betaine-aldehyde dehydrogenase
MQVGRAIRAGTVWVNTYHRLFPEAPFGGYKHSGLGRELGKEGLNEFLETKHLCLDSSPTFEMSR